MATVLDLASVESSDSSTKIHLMPCKIQHNSGANIAQFFETSIQPETTTGDLKASFRGRPLDGRTVKVPEGYRGVVLHEPHRPFDENEDREVKVSHTFQSFTHWNLDKAPSDDDTLKKALQWINISKAIHRPVDEDSSQKSVTGK